MIHKLKCRECAGRGRVHAPWRVCVQCGGNGFIIRDVDGTEEKMARGSRLGIAMRDKRLASKKTAARAKRISQPKPITKKERIRAKVNRETRFYKSDFEPS